MNIDFRVSVDFFTHHKARKLQKRLGPVALLSLLKLWAYAAKMRADGDLSGMTSEDVELAAEWEGDEGAFTATLLDVGFVDQDAERIRLHDWAENNPWVAEADARQDKSRFSRLASVNRQAFDELKAAGVNAISKEEYVRLTGNQRTPNERQTNVNASPSPAPAPVPSPAPTHKEQPDGCLSEAETSDDIAQDESQGESGKPQPPPCPHDQIREMYRESLPELPRAVTWGKDRQALLRTRWRETWERLRKAGKPHDLEALLAWWKAYFARVRTSPFLMGKVLDRNGKPFFADLEWLVRPSNYAKVIDGKYLERRPTP